MQFLSIYFSLSVLITFTILHAQSSSDLNQQGVVAYQKGKFEQACTYFTKALKQSPENTSIKNNLIAACHSHAARLQKQGNFDDAIVSLKETLLLLPNDTTLGNALLISIVNKGQTALNNHDYSTAKTAVYEVQQINNHHPATLILSGNLAYEQHDMAQALTYWQQALTLNPSDQNLSKRIQKVKKEAGSQKGYSQSTAYTFDIRFDYEAVGKNVYDIRSFLMEAYNRVGQDLKRYPSYPITVILSDENDFRLTNNVPEYIAGLYDGKIRLPVNFVRYPLPTVKGILFHEYTHAIIYDIAGSNCPIWINEGIAMREMNTQLPVQVAELVKALKSGTLLTLDQISAHSTWRSPYQLTLAYAQAWIMAEYLFYRWSNTQIITLLQQIKTGETFQSVLRNTMNRTPEQFEREWLAYAKGRIEQN